MMNGGFAELGQELPLPGAKLAEKQNLSHEAKFLIMATPPIAHSLT